MSAEEPTLESVNAWAKALCSVVRVNRVLNHCDAHGYSFVGLRCPVAVDAARFELDRRDAR